MNEPVVVVSNKNTMSVKKSIGDNTIVAEMPAEYMDLEVGDYVIVDFNSLSKIELDGQEEYKVIAIKPLLDCDAVFDGIVLPDYEVYFEK